MLNPLNTLTRTALGTFSLARTTAGKIISGIPGSSHIPGMGGDKQDEWRHATSESERGGGKGSRDDAGDTSADTPEPQPVIDTPPIAETAAAAVAREMASEVEPGRDDDPVALTGDAGDDVVTPAGIPAAQEGFNPDTAETDLVQPGTEPLVDPATTKAVKAEAETLGRASDPEKG